MSRFSKILICLCTVLMILFDGLAQIPEDFIAIEDLNANIRIEARYFSTNNFIGDTIKGYNSSKPLMTVHAAKQLVKVQEHLEQQGFGLKVFDAYRPQMAVDHFVSWAEDLSDTLKKSEYYPKVKKSKLFDKGYIASRSGHSRGSTVDLTIIELKTGKEVDMGSPFDLFDEKSHHKSKKVNDVQKKNRQLLKQSMEAFGFRAYSKEWWHYTLNNEPYPETYFNFPIH